LPRFLRRIYGVTPTEPEPQARAGEGRT
jgi:hypothetical protein